MSRRAGGQLLRVPGVRAVPGQDRTDTEAPEAIDSDEWADSPPIDDETRLRRLLETYVPEAADAMMGLTTCIATNSHDGRFYLDTPSEYPHVSVAAGCTGHGYKFCSVVGDVLADFATNGEPDHPIEVHQFAGRL